MAGAGAKRGERSAAVGRVQRREQKCERGPRRATPNRPVDNTRYSTAPGGDPKLNDRRAVAVALELGPDLRT
jgi:hypothetical protein